MDWILKALDSIQREIRPHVPSSSRQPAESFAPLSTIEQINDHLYEVRKPVGRPTVEFVFFHGLQLESSKQAHLTTWVTRKGSELWLDWLLTPFPQARVLLVSYDASPRKTEKEGLMDKYCTCENLLASLIEEAAQIGQDGCPVVFVGHCLGGLIMKQVCIHANQMLSLNPQDKPDEAIWNLLRNIKGLFFYATPHQGSRLADASRKFSRAPLFEVLTTLNSETARCNEDFRRLRIKYGWKAMGVGESNVVTLGQFKGFIVVEEASARHDVDKFYTIPTVDHFSICRPETVTSSSFYLLSDFVSNLLKEDKARQGHMLDLHDKVGLEGQVKRFQGVLKHAQRLGIVGMGGIGKTILAQSLYNSISGNFEYTCFLREVKRSMAKKENSDDLRAKIIRNLHCGKRKVHESFPWSMLKGKRILIVLDDAETDSQVQVMTEYDEFAVDSRIIVTSRKSRFLIAEKFECHLAHQLDENNSRTLLCCHAFNSTNPPIGYEDQVLRFVKKCEGLPLALEVVGKYLYKQPQGRWDEALEMLSRAEPLDGERDDALWPILRPSYDSLVTPQQEMFLDVAICFHATPLESVKEIWNVQWKNVDTLWANLVDKNLAHEDKDGNIQMHEVLRDLGRSIACPDPENILSHTRICSNELPTWPSNQGKPKVKTLKIVNDSIRKYDTSLWWRVEQVPDSNQWKLYDSLYDAFYRPYDSGDNININVETLQGLEQLTILWFEGVTLRGPIRLFPNNLLMLKSRYLVWETDFYSKFTRIFSQISRRHPTLRHLNLDRCGDVTGLVNRLGQLQAVEHLTLDCQKRLPPITFKQMRALKYLSLQNPYATALPNSLGKIPALEHLEICMLRLKALPSKLWQLGRLKHLAIYYCVDLQALPSTLDGFRGLRKLLIVGCPQLRALPDAIGNLRALERLDVIECGVESLPNSIAKLTALRMFRIFYCERLKFVPDVLVELQAVEHLYIEGCDDFERALLDITSPEKIVKMSWRLIVLHQKAVDKVRVSDYEGALTDLSSFSFEGLEPKYQGFLLQERGIAKRFMGDLHGARRDLTAALEVFSKAYDRSRFTYDCWKHRGFVSFLLRDLVGAQNDGNMALTVLNDLPIYYTVSHSQLSSRSLGDELITYMHFRLKAKRVSDQDVEDHIAISKKVDASDIPGALALLNALDARVSGFYNRVYLLQERGIMKRLVGDLNGALEDLTSALEIDHDNYFCRKHRGYVKYLLGDVAGARIDAEICVQEDNNRTSHQTHPMSLGYRQVVFLEFDL